MSRYKVGDVWVNSGPLTKRERELIEEIKRLPDPYWVGMSTEEQLREMRGDDLDPTLDQMPKPEDAK